MKRVAVVAGMLILSACAHHRDVRPGADGVNRVVVHTDDMEQGQRDAIAQAEHFCKERKLSPAFMDENSKYTGDMDEQTYKNAKRASKVAQVVGGTVWTMGGKKESTLGGLAGLGGTAADQALGKGYTVDMRFKCQ